MNMKVAGAALKWTGAAWNHRGSIFCMEAKRPQQQ